MAVTKTCERCGKEFSVVDGRKDTARFCSMSCKRIVIHSRSCPVCEKEFTPTSKQPNQVYCSRECSIVANMAPRHDITCANCGKLFAVAPGRLAESPKYCSYECSVTGRTKTPDQMTCPQCNTSFKPKHAKQIHCSRSCSHKNMNREIERTCERCGEHFFAKRCHVENGNARFCGKKCFHAYHKEYMTENPSRPRKQIELTCQWCRKKFERCESYIKRSDMRAGRYCSRDCKYAWQRSIVGENHPLDTKIECACEWCGKTYRAKRIYKGRTRFCSRRCQGSYSAANMDRVETTIEASIRNLLSAMNVTYEQEKKMGPWVCDFVIESAKLVVECDGIYWHSSPKVKKRDSQKDKWINTYGYKVLRLPEQLIKTDLTQCIERIQLFMNSDVNPDLPLQMKLF